MTLEEVIPVKQTNFLEDKANLILVRNSIIHPYQINLHKIIRNLGNIRVLCMDQDSRVIIRQSSAIIIINNKLPPKEQNQELAEELSHIILHCGNQVKYKKDIILDKQESQAKRMSAYLLCPMFMLKNVKIMENTYLMIEELAELFNVTYEFMEYRLSLIFGQDLNLIVHHKQNFYGYIPIE
ncbi:putative Zn peptidase [Gottschalkia purinilytica]|uniref:Putative Zn peptidase n=1 Tax=Gottschalkia purinilytica TaxID=1503 RepID=A0A0L0W9V7_GOTPU|nr:ImmA/IrrE family metallo-endopeptidase [Gottschalkia purinilytica]KNF08090.1 putative Zn peptidase [Gottschalkia purinilytica]